MSDSPFWYFFPAAMSNCCSAAMSDNYVQIQPTSPDHSLPRLPIESHPPPIFGPLPNTPPLPCYFYHQNHSRPPTPNRAMTSTNVRSKDYTSLPFHSRSPVTAHSSALAGYPLPHSNTALADTDDLQPLPTVVLTLGLLLLFFTSILFVLLPLPLRTTHGFGISILAAGIPFQ